MTISICNISKKIDNKKILHNINFNINKGEMVSLIGPSGSGKTTLLRMIAGLELVDEGSIFIDNQNISDKSFTKQKIGFVFQHYALFWHMNVFNNIAFGLKIKSKISHNEIKEKVFFFLKLMKLEEFSEKYPSELSGGQQQKVALARALITEPEILLMDEPFSAMDQKVRKELRKWMRKINREMNITIIFVTHDQEEAMELADKIIIMNKGKIIQIDTPEQVYNSPKNFFVYDFLGDYNIFDANIDDQGIGYIKEFNSEKQKISIYNILDNIKKIVNFRNWSLSAKEQKLHQQINQATLPNNNHNIKLFSRPHDILISDQNSNNQTIKAKLVHINQIFNLVKLELEKNDGSIILAQISVELFLQLNLKINEIYYIYPTKTQLFRN